MFKLCSVQWLYSNLIAMAARVTFELSDNTYSCALLDVFPTNRNLISDYTEPFLDSRLNDILNMHAVPHLCTSNPCQLLFVKGHQILMRKNFPF